MRTPVMKCLGIGIGLAVCVASSPSSAGYTYGPSVTVSTSGGYFTGTVTAARYSSDGNQQLGCETVYGSDGTTPVTYCWGEDATGNYAGCLSTDPNIATVAGRINTTTDLDVYFSTTTGLCTQVYAENGSEYIH
jgi:hypothetical protein